VNHGKTISKVINNSQYIRLERDGRITGAVGGKWKQAGNNGIEITVRDHLFKGVLVHQSEPDLRSYVLTFSAYRSRG
jgi:arabinan endo-1,5-alpha-L-arabinosidase